MTGEQRHRWWTHAGLAGCCLLMAMTLAGCGSTSRVKPVADGEYRRHLASCLDAIRDGELEQAEAYRRHAADEAQTPEQERQVADLGRLIDGAVQMMAGDVQAARTTWARIQDPRLRWEVSAKARRIGVDVPQMAQGDVTESIPTTVVEIK